MTLIKRASKLFDILMLAVGVLVLITAAQSNKSEYLESLQQYKPTPWNGSGVLRMVTVTYSNSQGSFLTEQGNDGEYHVNTYLAPGSTWRWLSINDGNVKSRILLKPATCGLGTDGQAHTGSVAPC
jgi:hypothetical protein